MAHVCKLTHEYRDLRLVNAYKASRDASIHEASRYSASVDAHTPGPDDTSSIRDSNPKIVDASSGSPQSRFKSPECTSPLRECAPAPPQLCISDPRARIRGLRIRIQEF